VQRKGVVVDAEAVHQLNRSTRQLVRRARQRRRFRGARVAAAEPDEECHEGYKHQQRKQAAGVHAAVLHAINCARRRQQRHGGDAAQAAQLQRSQEGGARRQEHERGRQRRGRVALDAVNCVCSSAAKVATLYEPVITNAARTRYVAFAARQQSSRRSGTQRQECRSQCGA
jgi:hypothetical protein